MRLAPTKKNHFVHANLTRLRCRCVCETPGGIHRHCVLLQVEQYHCRRLALCSGQPQSVFQL